MLILYTTQCCSTTGEVITTALYCKHWSYSSGERSEPTVTLQEEDFHWNLNFTISLMANLLNVNSVYLKSFRNLLMTAYIIEIQKSRVANINSVKLTILSQVAKLNSVYIFIP